MGSGVVFPWKDVIASPEVGVGDEVELGTSRANLFRVYELEKEALLGC